MAIFSSRLAIALALAASCLGGHAAHAQAAPVSYWTPGWPLGFGGNLADGQSWNTQTWNTYGNFPGFSASDARSSGLSYSRYNFSDGWFVGAGGGRTSFGMSGFNQAEGFGYSRSLDSQSVQFGYNFQGTDGGGLPVTVYAGFDSLNTKTNFGGALAPFDALSSNVPAYGAHAGVEYRPTSNLSLSLGVGYLQQPGVR
jgi:opacity protein-like surface antigen